MRKIYILILATILISGCSDNKNGTPYFTIESCFGGVAYYKIGHGVAPAYNTDGSLKLCEGKL